MGEPWPHANLTRDFLHALGMSCANLMHRHATRLTWPLVWHLALFLARATLATLALHFTRVSFAHRAGRECLAHAMHPTPVQNAMLTSINQNVHSSRLATLGIQLSTSTAQKLIFGQDLTSTLEFYILKFITQMKILSFIMLL